MLEAQHLHSDSQTSATLAPGDPTPFSDFLGQQAYVWYTYIHIGKTPKKLK